MQDDSILVERRDGIAVVTVNRPESRNAMTMGMWEYVPELMSQLGQDPAVRVIVIRGAGEKAFVSGANINQFTDPTFVEQKAHHYHEVVDRAIQSLEDVERPVIAMINGFALGGGCELAMGCDIRVVSETAKLGIPSANLGITISWYNTRRLYSLVGPSKAKEMLFTAKILMAQEALAAGLVDHVVPTAQLESSTFELASLIASKAPFTIRHAKKMINAIRRDPSLSGLTDEGELSMRSFRSQDFQEGVRAFLEKRPPKFEGR